MIVKGQTFLKESVVWLLCGGSRGGRLAFLCQLPRDSAGLFLTPQITSNPALAAQPQPLVPLDTCPKGPESLRPESWISSFSLSLSPPLNIM